MGKRIADHGIRPSLIITSPAVRARTTARLIAQELNYPLEFLQTEQALYLASLDRLLDIVAQQDDGFNNLMIVAHNPGLTEFANFLVPRITDNLPTSGVVSVEIDADDWGLYDRPTAELLVYDYPKLHR